MGKIYCTECGTKNSSDARFCEKCGEKIVGDDTNIKFCKYCGEKINADAEICPKCGVRLVSSFHNNTKKTVNSLSDSFKSFLKSKYFKILILAIIILVLAISTPKIIDSITPYKDVDSSYISNPVPFEKVRFTGEYVGETDTQMIGFYYFTTTYDVIKVDNQYVFLRENSLHISLKKGDIVQLEGKFSEGGKETRDFENRQVEGYWFAPNSYIIIN